jgi:hypothetical protein
MFGQKRRPVECSLDLLITRNRVELAGMYAMWREPSWEVGMATATTTA